ncbi:MAG: FtsX-like permease family protein [Cyanobacteria bacterium K_DeepCast_35m_m2_023]|nr:FtsX-like permease family protein [Cyanobacteria bacterium K_DeepCast_35m_m2_023]
MAAHLPLRDSLRMALRTLRSNGLRSVLTMLGITIGNASVITLVGVRQGTRNLAAEQLSTLGSNVLFVFPGSHNTRHQGVDVPRTLVLADAEAIAEQVPSVRAVAPQIALREPLQVRSNSRAAAVMGVTPAFLQVRRLEVAQGRFFTQGEAQAAHNVVVIGPDLRDQLFMQRQVLGERLRIRDQSFVVIGVMAPKGAVFGQNLDDNAYIPLQTMVGKLSGRDDSTGISLTVLNVEAHDKQRVNAAMFQITNLLRQRHHIRRDDDFEVRSQQEVMTIVGTITGGLSLMLTALGAISLLVGGIGIMNIMLVAVSERTSEIGLLKALGAYNSDVLLQFLLEAMVLSGLGGLVGAAAGVGAVQLIAAMTPLQAVVHAPTLLLSVGISGSIGLLFGVLPAQRAARLDPIAALQAQS